MEKSTGQDLAGDLLFGAEAIAQFVFGRKSERRKIYNLGETGALPTFRLGRVLCARRSSIEAMIARRDPQTKQDREAV
jgi:hypothetical protein